MSDNDIINSWELVQTEKERWADKLARPIPGDDCCTYECNQGRNCPVRADKAPAPKYCDRSKQNCGTPYTCSPLCRLIDSQLPVQMIEPPRRAPILYVFAVVGALIGFALALYQTF